MLDLVPLDECVPVVLERGRYFGVVLRAVADVQSVRRHSPYIPIPATTRKTRHGAHEPTPRVDLADFSWTHRGCRLGHRRAVRCRPSPRAPRPRRPARPPRAEISTAKNAKLGTILVSDDGNTVYTLKPSKTACTAECLKAWPPVLLPDGVTTATAGTGVDAVEAGHDARRRRRPPGDLLRQAALLVLQGQGCGSGARKRDRQVGQVGNGGDGEGLRAPARAARTPGTGGTSF